jgi:hypothetical protein
VQHEQGPSLGTTCRAEPSLGAPFTPATSLQYHQVQYTMFKFIARFSSSMQRSVTTRRTLCSPQVELRPQSLSLGVATQQSLSMCSSTDISPRKYSCVRKPLRKSSQARHLSSQVQAYIGATLTKSSPPQ